MSPTSSVMSTGIRSSQRAPRSCMRCAKKRIKCDKNIPCQTCVSRGLESSCTRETVRVKGKIVSYVIALQGLLANESRRSDVTRGSPGASSGPSYADLLDENRRLKAALENQTPIPSERSESPWPCGDHASITETFENDVHPAILHAERSSTIHSLADICMPHLECSQFLLEHGVIWTSWIHFAIHVPTFRLEHDTYWSQSEQTPILHREPLWLAIYFSFLAVCCCFPARPMIYI